MTPTFIPAALRQMVIERASGRCEYCRYPQEMAFLAFEVEHTVHRFYRSHLQAV